jgi:hypothetical protein
MIAYTSDCFSRTLTNWAVGLSLELLTIKILLFSQRKPFSCTRITRFEIFRAFSSGSLAYRACCLFGELGFDDSAIIDISNGDGYG